MRKRSFLLKGILALALIFGLVLASCDDGTSTAASKVALQTLSAPTNVKATAFGATGVIRVTWAPVANAKSYDVYRKSVASSKQGGETLFYYKATVTAASNANAGYVGYQDLIATTNEFKPDVTYTYKVVAISQWSSYNKETGTNVWNPNADLALQNSSADSNGVKFGDPANSKAKNPLTPIGSKLPTPEITLNPDPVKTYSIGGITENLQVSFDVSPGVNYIVYYSYGSNYLIFGSNSFYKNVPSSVGQTKYIGTFPLINGKTNVQVVAQVASGYYQDSDPAVQNYEHAKSILPNITSFSATASNGVIFLSWDNGVAGASYKVYRFTSAANGYASGGYIFDEWAEVTDKVKPIYDDGTSTWNAFDTDLNDKDQSYVYMVIASLGDAKSIPATVSLASPNGVSAPIPTITDLGWDAENKVFRGVQIWWTARLGQTFKLYRKEVILDDSGSFIIGPKDGSWDTGWGTELTGVGTIPTNNNDDSMDMGLIDKPPVKAAYKYKLVTTQGGLSAEKFADLKTAPYSNAVSVAINVVSTPAIADNTAADITAGWTTPKNRGIAYTIGITLTTDKDQLSALLAAGDVVKIYRANTNSSGKELGAYTEISFDSATFLAQKQVVDTLTEPDYPGYYEYKAAVVSSSGNQIKNIENSRIMSTSYTRAVPTLVVSGAARRFEFTSITKTEYIQGQTLYYRFIDVALGGSAPTNTDWLDAPESQLTYARNPVVANPASADLYFTANVSVPAPGATSTRYYQLQALRGDGTRDTLIYNGTF